MTVEVVLVLGGDSQATDARIVAQRNAELDRAQEHNVRARAARRRHQERMRKLRAFAKERTMGAAARVGGDIADAMNVRGPIALARGARMLANPFVLLGAALVGAAAVAARLGSGRSFENMGQVMREFLFGEMSSDAIAGMEAREVMTGNASFARIVGMQGKANSQMLQVYQGIERVKKMSARGRELLEADPTMQRNGTVDNLILRGQQIVTDAWKSSSGPAAVDRWGRMYQEQGQTKSPR